MNCDEISPHLGGLLDRALTPELANVVEEHISLCASCRFTFEQLQSLRVALRSSSTYMPSTALDERVMGAFRQHHRLGPAAAAARRWQRLILGSVSIPKPALAIAGAAMVIALVAAFNAGRITASRAAHDTQPQARQIATSPTIVKVPVERDRIVYVKVPDSRTRAKSRPPRPVSAESVADPPVARAPGSFAGDSKPATVSLSVKSLEDFEPIKGAIGRVIEGSKHQ